VELQSFTSCLRGEDSIMPSRPSQTKLNSAVRKLKQTGRELERAGHRLEIVRRDAERQARRTRSQLRMQPNTSTHLSPSEWHLLEQVHEHVAADPLPREHDVFLSHAGVHSRGRLSWAVAPGLISGDRVGVSA